VLELRCVSLKEANAFVEQHHRHHGRATGHKFSIGLYNGDRLIGVSIVGRPTGRYLDDGHTLEVTRLCTDGTKNACSMLYGASAREARKKGYAKILTFILQSEPGTSLRAAGWHLEAGKAGKPKWNTQRYAKKPIQLSLFPKREPPLEYKQRWSKILAQERSKQ
jgi:hypothetical protein